MLTRHRHAKALRKPSFQRGPDSGVFCMERQISDEQEPPARPKGSLGTWKPMRSSRTSARSTSSRHCDSTSHSRRASAAHKRTHVTLMPDTPGKVALPLVCVCSLTSDSSEGCTFTRSNSSEIEGHLLDRSETVKEGAVPPCFRAARRWAACQCGPSGRDRTDRPSRGRADTWPTRSQSACSKATNKDPSEARPRTRNRTSAGR